MRYGGVMAVMGMWRSIPICIHHYHPGGRREVESGSSSCTHTQTPLCAYTHTRPTYHPRTYDTRSGSAQELAVVKRAVGTFGREQEVLTLDVLLVELVDHSGSSGLSGATI